MYSLRRANLRELNLPVTSYCCVPRGCVSVASQHFEGGRLACSVNSQQTEALTGQKGDSQCVRMRAQ